MTTSRKRGRLLRMARARPAATVGGVLLLLFVLMAIGAQWLMPYDPQVQVGPVFGPPSSAHPLGLDDGGYDVLSLIIQGGRISMIVGFAATLVATILGGGIGIISGYFGGATDTVLMRITDYFLVIPDIPLMIIIAAVWGPSLSHIILVIGLLCVHIGPHMIDSPIHHRGGPLFFALSLVPLFLLLWWLRRQEQLLKLTE